MIEIRKYQPKDKENVLKILFGKLYDIMINQDSDFDEWLKFSENFEEDNRFVFENGEKKWTS